jgi:hypothetical protein
VYETTLYFDEVRVRYCDQRYQPSTAPATTTTPPNQYSQRRRPRRPDGSLGSGEAIGRSRVVVIAVVFPRVRSAAPLARAKLLARFVQP